MKRETKYSKRTRFANSDKFSEEYTSDYSTYSRQRAITKLYGFEHLRFIR